MPITDRKADTACAVRVHQVAENATSFPAEVAGHDQIIVSGEGSGRLKEATQRAFRGGCHCCPHVVGISHTPVQHDARNGKGRMGLAKARIAKHAKQ